MKAPSRRAANAVRKKRAWAEPKSPSQRAALRLAASGSIEDGAALDLGQTLVCESEAALGVEQKRRHEVASATMADK